ncbi:hypothetical protein GSI_11020 [Ganoderma sinense ZZ0214-1]|uniref:Uncharacterized protein n=1 Tax=Ganoderma sinense ZZ0214-1 TaxID=1077348 RepID=A0A2G8RVM8_9APHY|nr:hypothetical protein GSI_12365 [Ganoderma sinense ZZ0214-1]PIL27864.1 hypothetical protein GSI_11020 [Ganoderma sinense ZZ0214-1]
MPVASRIRFVHFTPRDTGLPRKVYRSDRDILRGDLRGGFDTTLGVVDMTMCYTAEEYARIIVCCLGWILDGWPYYIPFTNLSNIKGGVRPLRILWDLWQAGTLRFVRAPPDVRERALHDPESVLPHVMAAAALPPLTRMLSPPKFTLSRFQDLLPRSARLAPLPAPRTKSAASALTVRSQAPAQELVLHPDNLEPILSMPLDPASARPPHERRQRCDINQARHRPTGKKSHSRKVGPLTSRYVLDTPSAPSTSSTGRAMKPLSEHRLPLMVDEFIGDYAGRRREEAEIEDIESFSDVDE